MPKLKRKEKAVPGLKVRAARASLRESQAAFAERFKVNPSTVQRWEQKGISKGTSALLFTEFLVRLKLHEEVG